MQVHSICNPLNNVFVSDWDFVSGAFVMKSASATPHRKMILGASCARARPCSWRLPSKKHDSEFDFLLSNALQCWCTGQFNLLWSLCESKTQQCLKAANEARGEGFEQINYWMYQQGRGTAPASPPAWGFGTRKNKAARLTMGYVDYLSFKTAGRGRMGIWMGLITSSLSADNRHFVVLFVVACKAEWKRRGPGFILSICNEILLPCASCAASASPQRRIRP